MKPAFASAGRTGCSDFSWVPHLFSAPWLLFSPSPGSHPGNAQPFLQPCCGALQSNTAACCKSQPPSQANELGTLANPEINKFIGSSWLHCSGHPIAPIRSVASSLAGCSQVGQEHELGAFHRIPALGNENRLGLSSSGASKQPVLPVPPNSSWDSRYFKSSSQKTSLGPGGLECRSWPSGCYFCLQKTWCQAGFIARRLLCHNGWRPTAVNFHC